MDRRLSARREISGELVFNCISCRSSEEITGRAFNLSESGILIETPHRAVNGQVLKLLRGIDAELPRFGEVAWTGQADSNYKLGIRFVDEDEIKHHILLESIL